MNRGFTLMELVVALAIGALLTTGMIQLALATTAGFRLQQTLSSLQENGRFIGRQLQDAIRPAGFHPEPWSVGPAEPAIGDGSADAVAVDSDRLEVRRWSDRNCFDNPNPATDVSGLPRHFLRITRFELRNGSLALNCGYGADEASLVTQLNNLGLVEDVEVFAVQYAEDADGDGQAERWLDAGQWAQEENLLGVRYALVLASPRPIEGVEPTTLWWPGGSYAPPGDGRLRRVFTGTVALAGRLP